MRRIEAVAGEAAIAHFAWQEEMLVQANGLLNTSTAELPGRIEALLDERKRLERELSETRRKLATGGQAASQPAKQIDGIAFAGRRVEGVPAKELRGMADDLKKQIGSGVVALVAVDDGKASLVVGVTDDLTDRFDAVALVREGAAALGGKGGGGRPDMAQAGGPDATAAEKALDTIEHALAARAGAD